MAVVGTKVHGFFGSFVVGITSTKTVTWTEEGQPSIVSAHTILKQDNVQ